MVSGFSGRLALKACTFQVERPARHSLAWSAVGTVARPGGGLPGGRCPARRALAALLSRFHRHPDGHESPDHMGLL